MKLSSLDLNRLLLLHVVLEQRSVTRAAASLHVTPSAVSNALAQLRASFGDPLLVRSGRGLVPTPRAVALAPLLAEAIAALTRAVEGDAAFDPRTTTRRFAIATSDAEQIAEIPRIAAALASRAPRAGLRVLSVEQLEAAGGLARAEVDVALGPAHPPTPGVHAQDLYQEEGVLVVRRNHPRVRRRMTREQFNQLRHVDILLALDRGGVGHGMVEAFLATHGLQRDIAVSAPSFTAAANIVAQTDWVGGLPRRLAELFVRQLPLRIVSLPAPPMTFRMQLLWHERTHDDEGARFFRALVASCVGARRR